MVVVDLRRRWTTTWMMVPHDATIRYAFYPVDFAFLARRGVKIIILDL